MWYLFSGKNLFPSSFNRLQSSNSWDNFTGKAKIQDIYNRLSGLCLCLLPLGRIFYGSSDKGHFVATPSIPCPELALPECTNCCWTKVCLMSLCSHCHALILYGVGIKTASVSSQRAEHSSSLHAWGSACEVMVCKKATGFTYLAAGRDKHLGLVLRVPLGTRGCEWLSGVPLKCGELFSAVQKHAMYQLDVDLRRNSFLLRLLKKVTMKNNRRTRRGPSPQIKVTENIKLSQR